MIALSRLLMAVGMVVAGTLAGQNPLPVVIRLGTLQSVPLPLGWVVLAAAGLGMISSVVISILWGKPRLSSAARQLQSRLGKLEMPSEEEAPAPSPEAAP
jgi:hypothetical protein